MTGYLKITMYLVVYNLRNFFASEMRNLSLEEGRIRTFKFCAYLGFVSLFYTFSDTLKYK
jgi:hypothetical protein